MVETTRPVDASAVPDKPTVLIVEPVGGHGGMDFWDHSLCESLVDVGWRPLLLTSSAIRGKPRRYEVREVYQGVFGPDSKIRRGMRYVRASLKGLRRGRELGARVAHFHLFHADPLQYLNVVLARALGMRVVLSAHDVGSFRKGESKRLLLRLYERCAAVIAHSERARSVLQADANVPAEKIFIVPHGNYEGFLPALPAKVEAKASFGFGDDEFVLLFFGQIKRIKRLDLLLQATGLAVGSGAKRLRLLVAGSISDSDPAELARLVAEGGLERTVRLDMGYVGNDELPRYFAAADIAVLPYDNIYQSGVVLLAMTNGVPVLTSDIPGMREVVEHGRTGLTFRAGDPDDLAAKLVALERGEWDLAGLSAEARLFVATQHSWRSCASATADAYRAALSGPRAGAGPRGAHPVRGAT